MAEEKTEFELGWDGEEKNVMVVFIPIKALSENMNYGTALLRGRMEEIKAMALLNIQERRAKKQRVGIIQGNGQPLHVA